MLFASVGSQYFAEQRIAPDDEPDVAEIDVEAMSTDELRKLTLHLRDSLKTREVQLERKFEEVANMQEVTHRLMVRHPDIGGESRLWIPSFFTETSA